MFYHFINSYSTQLLHTVTAHSEITMQASERFCSFDSLVSLIIELFMVFVFSSWLNQCRTFDRNTRNGVLTILKYHNICLFHYYCRVTLIMSLTFFKGQVVLIERCYPINFYQYNKFSHRKDTKFTCKNLPYFILTRGLT